MNTILILLSNTEITISLGILSLIICVAAIYRTAVSNNRTSSED